MTVDTSTDLGIHPYADKFPMLPEPDLAELAESIRVNGLRQPIVVTPDGLILDGRNRYAACQRLGVEPDVTVYEGGDLAEYVIDANTARRHMSTGARAMATALVLSDDGRRANGRWRRGTTGIYESVNSDASWSVRMAEAGIVLDHAPDLADAVVNGDLALDAAYRQACERRDAERDRLADAERLAAVEAEAREFIEANAPDLAAMVGDTFQTYTEAHAIWEQRNREEAERIRREKAAREKREADERRARTDLYTGIARNIEVVAAYGRYPDTDSVMGEYDPNELATPADAASFETSTLADAQRFIDRLIKWSKQ